jgi:ABC-type sugar transport system ATPase subunit
LNNIYNDYDTRLEITDEILPMVEDEEYVIIFGNSQYGRSTLLKRLIIEEDGVFFLSIETIN